METTTKYGIAGFVSPRSWVNHVCVPSHRRHLCSLIELTFGVPLVDSLTVPSLYRSVRLGLVVKKRKLTQSQLMSSHHLHESGYLQGSASLS